MSKTIEIEVSEDQEHTSAPYWLIIDPVQMMEPNIHSVANMVTGPFFSRESAESHLENRRYAFGENAKVYCHSGWQSNQYSKALKEAGIR